MPADWIKNSFTPEQLAPLLTPSPLSNSNPGVASTGSMTGGGNIMGTWREPVSPADYIGPDQTNGNFYNFLGLDFSKLSNKNTEGIRRILNSAGKAAQQQVLAKIVSANPKTNSGLQQLIKLLKQHSINSTITAKSGGVTVDSKLTGSLRGVTAPQLPGGIPPEIIEEASQNFDHFIGLHTRVLDNRANYSSFDGDDDFHGFTEDEVNQYYNFLGLDKIRDALGSAAKAVGHAVGSAATAVGHGVRSVGLGIAHTGRDIGVGVAHGVARAGLAVGQTTARGAVFAARNAGGILTTAAGVGLELVPGFQAEGGALIGAGLGSIIADAQGNGLNSQNTQTAQDAALAAMAGGAGGGMMGGGDGFNPDGNPFGWGADIDNTVGTSDLAPAPVPEPQKPKPFYKKPEFIIAAAIVAAIAGYFLYKHFKKHGLKLKK